MFNVIQIVFKFDDGLGNGGGITIINLRPPGDTRLNQQSCPVQGDMFLVFYDQFGTFGARPDDTHVAAQYIPELRQFIYVTATKDITHRRDTVIMFVGYLHLAILFRIPAHGTEFVNAIQLTAFSRTDLAVKDG